VFMDLWVALIDLAGVPILGALVLRALHVHHPTVWMQALAGAIEAQAALPTAIAYRLARLRFGPTILCWGAALQLKE